MKESIVKKTVDKMKGENMSSDEIVDVVDEIKNSKKRKDFDQIIIPNEHANAKLNNCLKEGENEIEDKIVKSIKNLLI